MALTLDEVVEATDLQLHPDTRREVDPVTRAATLREELAWAVETATTDLEFARDYRQHMPHPGTEPQDYLNRWVRIAPDLEVLLGPRHRARDITRPFIAVEAASRPITRKDLPEMRAASRAAFPQFGARAVVFWDWRQPDQWTGATADMRLHAAQLGTLRKQQVATALSVAPATDTSFYDRYRAGYLELFDRRPEAREWTQLKELADLEDLQRQYLVLEVFVDDDWAGLVAGQPATRAGLRGLEVVEIFLFQRYRGRRLGTALSVALAHHTDLPDTDFLLGTIHWQNRAARTAALAAGRQDRGGEVVLPLTTTPG